MPVKPKDAAAIILLKDYTNPRVYWIKRSQKLAFMGGFHAFPGGQLDADDFSVSVAGCDKPEESAMRACAVRELFEETGVLLASGAEPVSNERLKGHRIELARDEKTFSAMLKEESLQITAAGMEPAGRWVTPPFAPRRFDTWFFIAWLPDGQDPVIEKGELETGEWVRPADAVARWKRGEVIMAPPTLHALRTLADYSDKIGNAATAMKALPEANRGLVRRIEFGPGIFFFPVRTPTLPPATHTNCYIIGGEELVVIEPASPYEDEQRELDDFIDQLIGEGRKVREVILTHHHIDHVGGVNHLRNRLGVPVAAHRITAERLSDSVQVDRFIEDGDVIELAGDPGWRLRALHTPGHTRGHLCFYEENSAAVITGDLIVGVGTVVIDPPEGNMRQYFDSLRLLLKLPRLGTLFGAHGPVIAPAREKIQEYIDHRTARETKIHDAVKSGATSLDAIVAFAYTDVSPSLHGLARRSALAHLEKLEEERAVISLPQGYVAAT
ncbi:MAG TPA: MBL fold metallo-hydrolase [Blastocatellia bacterium]|nr:MBL fold metallo-hydrolase [Blastocatellia bacterium]